MGSVRHIEDSPRLLDEVDFDEDPEAALERRKLARRLRHGLRAQGLRVLPEDYDASPDF